MRIPENKETRTYVTGKFDKFVVVYNGLAYWFKMKDQYLYRVSTEEDFHQESENITIEIRKYTQIPGSIISLNILLRKIEYYAAHPIDIKGNQRQGIELLKKEGEK